MNEQVLEKLKKILRLANNEAATQGEIESAMARAKEIAMQHDIDLSMVDHTDPNAKAKSIEVEKGEVSIEKKRMCHNYVCQVIKQVFGVYIVNCHSHYAFIGDKHDVPPAREIFIYLESAYYKAFSKQVKDRILSNCAADKNGFFAGLTRGILEVNVRTVKESLTKAGVDSNKYAVVLRNKETAIQQAVPSFFPRLCFTSSRVRTSSERARAIGHAEGRKINLHQVGGGRGASGQLN